MPAPSGQTCLNCQFQMQGTISNKMECRNTSPMTNTMAAALWPQVRAEDWCGEWAPLGHQDVNRFIVGSVDVTSTTPSLLMSTDNDPVYTVAAMRSCQITSNSNQIRYMRFLDGPTGKLLTTIAVAAGASLPLNFNSPIVSYTGSIYVAFTVAGGTGDVAVSAQGTKEQP